MADYSIKPLDGSPLMSANCWNTVLASLKERGKSEESVRCLEWGAGNSTISLVKTGLSLRKKFELHSADHDTRFYPFLAESVIGLFPTNGRKITWQKLGGRALKFGYVGRLLKKHSRLESKSSNWQVIHGNKRIQYAEQFSPIFGFSPLRLLKQLVKFVLIRMGYLIWLVRALLNKKKSYLLEESNFQFRNAGDFQRYFEAREEPGCLTVSSGQTTVHLWHIPELRTTFWSKGVIYDGSIWQLPDFVDLPVEGEFDLAFVDGRARIACMKRVYYERMLKKGGYLFVHDAYRSEMAEGFKLFNPTATFIQGSNITLSGNIRCTPDFGFPLIRVGEEKGKVEYKIAQELFMYQN